MNKANKLKHKLQQVETGK